MTLWSIAKIKNIRFHVLKASGNFTVPDTDRMIVTVVDHQEGEPVHFEGPSKMQDEIYPQSHNTK